MKRKSSLISLILCISLLLSSIFVNTSVSAKDELVDSGIDYSDSTVSIYDNPERGGASARWIMAYPDGADVISPSGGIFTVFYDMRAFSAGYADTKVNVGGADIPLTDAFLESVNKTLKNARESGTAIITRFSYAWDGAEGNEPADFNMLLHHIEQISEVLNANKDVVISIEAGMAGPCGEMHSSKYTTAEYIPQMLSKWLECLDPEITVQTRSSAHILWYYQMTAGEFAKSIPLSTENYSRLGMFNDGYLGTYYDYGTYTSTESYTATQMTRGRGIAFLNTVPGVPYGGEIATVDEDFYQDNAKIIVESKGLVEELYDTHLSYLRNLMANSMTIPLHISMLTFDSSYSFAGMPDVSEYYGQTLQKFMFDHMGYRILIRDAKMTASASPGGKIRIKGTLQNTGFGDFASERKTDILLVNGPSYYCITSSFDANSIRSKKTATYDMTLNLPKNITEGRWEIYMRIRNERITPEYSERTGIRFANDGIFESSIRANKIGYVDISGSAVSDNMLFYEEGFIENGTGELTESTMSTVILNSPPYTQNVIVNNIDFDEPVDGGITFVFKTEGIESPIVCDALDMSFKSQYTDSDRGRNAWNWITYNRKLTLSENGDFYLYIGSQNYDYKLIYTLKGLIFFDDVEGYTPENTNENAKFTLLAAIPNNLEPTVTFHNGDTVMKSVKYKYTAFNTRTLDRKMGKLKTVGELVGEYSVPVPEKEDDELYTYIFDCWTDIYGRKIDDKSLYEDTDAYAKFRKIRKDVKPVLCGATMVISNGTGIYFLADKEYVDTTKYDGLEVKAIFAGGEYTLPCTEDEKNLPGYFVFPFKNISPDMMNEEIEAKLTANGGEYESEGISYSIAEYISNMTEKALSLGDERSLSLISALQAYCEASAYYLAETAAISEGTEAVCRSADTEKLVKKCVYNMSAAEDPAAKWKSASLRLNSGIDIRLSLEVYDDTDDIRIKVSNSSGNIIGTLVHPDSVENGIYTYTYRGLNISGIYTTLKFTPYRYNKETKEYDIIAGGELTYSAASYMYRMRSKNERLGLLIGAITALSDALGK